MNQQNQNLLLNIEIEMKEKPEILIKKKKQRIDENTEYILQRLIAFFNGTQLVLRTELPHLPIQENGSNESEELVRNVFFKAKNFFPMFNPTECEMKVKSKELYIKRTVPLFPTFYCLSTVFSMSTTPGIDCVESLDSFKNRYFKRIKKVKDENFRLGNPIVYKLNKKVNVKENHCIQLKNFSNYSVSKILENAIRFLPSFANRDGGIFKVGVDDYEICKRFNTY